MKSQKKLCFQNPFGIITFFKNVEETR